MAKKAEYLRIPVDLTQEQYEQYFCDHLSSSPLGRKTKISNYKFLRYILKVLHTGMQWFSLQIATDESGKPEIHYTSIYKRFKIWSDDGSLADVFESSVCRLNENGLLDFSIVHGDGSCTVAKKGGDNLGRNGHKHHKGEKVVAMVDRNVNILSPFVTAPWNRNETVLLEESLNQSTRVAGLAAIDLKGSVMSLDGGYDSVANRKLIFNRGMIPNIKENKRNRKRPKRGRKRIYNKGIYRERFQTVERAFAWEDKFKRVLIRFERISSNHMGMKLLAFSLINLRHFC
jgi:transposase